MDKYGAIAVGGSSPLVTQGGYILGGGHSPITRMKGLGVDQVVAFEMVTANGSIVYMTEEGKDFFKIMGGYSYHVFACVS